MSPSKKSKTPRLFYLLAIVTILIATILYKDKFIRHEPKIEPAVAPPEVEVLDGDTFVDAQGRTIRLLGIDTPEKGEPFSQQAKEQLRQLLRAGSTLRYEFGKEHQDRYGRTLAFVYVDTLFVNERLIEDGLASAYFFEDQLAATVFAELCSAQRAAIRDHVGIWSKAVSDPETLYVGNSRSKRFHRPNCPSIEDNDSKRIVRNSSRDFFLNECYSPCRNCKP